MKKFAAVVVVAILLGMVSPFMAAVDDGPLLRAWLQWLPVQVDLWVLPEGEAGMLLLAMGVLTCQYLLLFAVVAQTRVLVRRLVAVVQSALAARIQVTRFGT